MVEVFGTEVVLSIKDFHAATILEVFKGFLTSGIVRPFFVSSSQHYTKYIKDLKWKSIHKFPFDKSTISIRKDKPVSMVGQSTV